MKIRAISTFTDWTAMAGCWGRTGVCRLFEALRIAGIEHVYWRVFNGGLAMYPSRVSEVQGRQCYDEVVRDNPYPFANRPFVYRREIDFNTYDPIADAAELAQEFGITLHLWYSIYEDEHGRPSSSLFNQQNRRFWQMDRDGHSYSGALDWFYEEVRELKLGIIDELLQYASGGLLLDLVRHNATASGSADGVHRFGYNPEIRAAFKQAHGADPIDLPTDHPEWLAFKTDIQTSLIRDIRARMDKSASCRELSLMLWTVDYARWCCFDVPALAREGAVQLLCGSSLPYSFRPQEAAEQYRVLRAQAPVDTVKVLPAFMAYGGAYGSQVEAFAGAAEQAGADEIMLLEADAMVRFNFLPTVRAINKGVPTYARPVRAARVADDTAGDAIPWDAVPLHTDFLCHYGPGADPQPCEKTAVQIAYGTEAVVVRVVCGDAAMDVALAPIDRNAQHQYYLDALGMRGPYFAINSFSLILDPRHSHEDFFRFGVTPKNEQIAATFVDETWSGAWSSSVVTAEDRWTATLRIPYASLGVSAPEPGDVWGVNLVRGIRASGEIDMWVTIAGQQSCPHELGHLTF